MEKSEPALVPEWLRCTGSVTGGGTSAHHFASSSSYSDVPFSAHSMRNRSSRSISDKDSPRSAFLDRSTSSNSRHSSSSNGSTKHPYSNFTRSHRDKTRDKEKERSDIRDLWDHDCSDPLGNILTGRVENITLRRSLSMVSRKPVEVLRQKHGVNLNQNISNGVLSGGMKKAAFEKDFPSLGTEEKQGVPDTGRVSSPGLSTVVQSLPIGNSGLIGGEGWTSALAEVPTIIGSSSMVPASVQQSSVVTPSSGASSAMVGLNMAETLSQAPSHSRTTVQLPDKTQRLEELAIKQSRQLIPMTPSTPKPMVLNSDKSKQPKAAARTSEMILPAKSVQQQPSSQLANQSLRGGQIRTDSPKTSHVGKFLVLKPVWENGLSSAAKDVSSPINNGSSRVANSHLAVVPSTPTAPLTANHPKLSTIERKTAALALNPRSNVDKRPSLSQVQSRSDFFDLMRKKTSVNPSAILPDSSPAVLSPAVKNSGGVIKEIVSASVIPHVTDNGSKMTNNGDIHEDPQRFYNAGEKNLNLNRAIYPDEEEAAFLRSLGWEENAGEDEGLTEEEISAFYQECLKLRPPLKMCQGAQPKFAMLSETCLSNSGRDSSEIRSSESESEA